MSIFSTTVGHPGISAITRGGAARKTHASQRFGKFAMMPGSGGDGDNRIDNENGNGGGCGGWKFAQCFGDKTDTLDVADGN